MILGCPLHACSLLYHKWMSFMTSGLKAIVNQLWCSGYSLQLHKQDIKQHTPPSANTKPCRMTLQTAKCHGKYDWGNFLTVSQLRQTYFLMRTPCCTVHVSLLWCDAGLTTIYAFPHSFVSCSHWHLSLLWKDSNHLMSASGDIAADSVRNVFES